ncbi:MAG: peptidoglycan-binding protein [Lachnospiraceae bacterium]
MPNAMLQVLLRSKTSFTPIVNAQVTIRSTDMQTDTLLQYATNESGQTPIITLSAPPSSYSESPDEPRPYSTYTIFITAPDFEEIEVEGIELLPGVLALQEITMTPSSLPNSNPEIIVIPPHTLYGDYPAKIPEAQVKPVPDSGDIVLNRVVIPEYIIVHDGTPDNRNAKDYYVRYIDYIKNVACSEIYATWEDSTILANVLCIMSFTLNRVYTEWYRSRGYTFTITSSTAYDQKWIYGRNIFSNVSYLVDQVFNNYLARPGIAQPIFTSYCDGQRVTCSGLSQWGSKYLGDEGLSAIEIVRNYFGPDMYIASATQISGVPSSYPGYELINGTSGDKVRQIQTQLNRIARNYPAIPTIIADGIYGPKTAETVKSFQKIFALPVTGIVDFATWYAISRIYVGVTRISEPGS